MKDLRLGKHLRGLALACLAVAIPAARSMPQNPDGPDLPTRASQMRPRPGDKVVVHVYGDPTLSDAATLDEKGRIMLPKIGLIQADAVSIAALRDTVRARLSTILRDPAIEVSVLRRVIVSGEAIKPGVYYADLTTSIGEVVALAGGLRETASSRKVFLIRGSQRVHLKQWESDQSPASDLNSGDQISIGRKSWLELNIIPFASVSLAVVSLVISLRR